MTRAEYVELVDLLDIVFRILGIPDLSDPSLYADRDPETGELSQLHPRNQLVGMLEALERHLSVSDRETYRRALEQINESLEGSNILSASVIPFNQDSEPISFDVLPELRPVRALIDDLIQEFVEDPDPNSETDL